MKTIAVVISYIIVLIISLNVSLKLISEPNDIALYAGLIVLALSVLSLIYPINLISKKIKQLNKN